MPNLGKIKYTKDQLMSAVAVVRDDERIKTSGNKFGVSRSTLQRYIKGRDKSTFGPKSVLSVGEEMMLVNNWLLNSGRKGFPRRRGDI